METQSIEVDEHGLPHREQPAESFAYERWKRAARNMQHAHHAFKLAAKEHDEAFKALGNIVAPQVTE